MCPVGTLKRKPFPEPPPDSDADDTHLTHKYSIGRVRDNHNWFRPNLKIDEDCKKEMETSTVLFIEAANLVMKNIFLLTTYFPMVYIAMDFGYFYCGFAFTFFLTHINIFFPLLM